MPTDVTLVQKKFLFAVFAVVNVESAESALICLQPFNVNIGWPLAHCTSNVKMLGGQHAILLRKQTHIFIDN